MTDLRINGAKIRQSAGLAVLYTKNFVLHTKNFVLYAKNLVLHAK
jgi:hypothetical protein